MDVNNKNNFIIEGTLKAIFETQKVSEKFSKREFILGVSDGSQYEQLVKFELLQDKTGKLDLMKNGEPVKVEFQLRGREWTDPQGQKKFFTTLNALDVQPLFNDAGSRVSSNDSFVPAEPPPSLPEDDLPF